MMIVTRFLALGLMLGAFVGAPEGASAQASGEGTITLPAKTEPAKTEPANTLPAKTQRPKPRPVAVAPAPEAPADAAVTEAAPAKPVRDPSKGAVTNLPIPRYVTLKGNEGNARRGPSLTHRIDWVFTTSGMPLRVTAEHENWRRVEDADGAGGWVHYSLLSGARAAMTVPAMTDFYTNPSAQSQVAFQAEAGVIGKITECQPDWCRLNVRGEKGWVQKTALWGVDPGEVLE